MSDNFVPFLIGVAILVVYLVFSALTEMGTRLLKLPWQHRK